MEPELRDETVEPLPVGRADVDRDPYPSRNDVDRSGLDVDDADGGHRPVDGRCDVAHAQDVLGRRDQCVGTPLHRDGARVADVPVEGALAADDADDPHREPQWRARALQHGPLLDVHLEEALRQRAARDEGGAADAAALLVAKDDHCSLADTLDRLDRRDDAERTVELPSERHGVEMRAGPDSRFPSATDEIPRLVDLDLEPCLTHPCGRQLVGAILTLAAGNAIGADPAADGVELVEALVHAHAAIIPLGRDAVGHVPVPGTGTTLCQLRA